MARLQSAFSKLVGVEHPVLLAGMAVVSSPRLAAAVSNAGGLGVLGAGFPNPSPRLLSKMVDELVSLLDEDKKTCFGVDLLIPQVGGSARATNYDYTRGALPEMVDIICKSGCRLFVCAVGIPPPWMVEKLHSSNVLVMNMVGSPRHVEKCLQSGVDAICAQGYEGGGHTGEIGTMVLIPKVVDMCRGKKSPLTGGPIHVVAGGGIYNGRTMAAAFSLGAEAVWVGTRFVASKEATTTVLHQNVLLKAGAEDTIRSEIYTGRPARVYKTPYVLDWAWNRRAELDELLKKGKIPYAQDMKKTLDHGKEWSMAETAGLSFSQSAGAIDTIESADTIVNQLVTEAVDVLRSGAARVVAQSHL